MRRFKIKWNAGTFLLETRTVEVEDFECEQDAVDKMIDDLEENGEEGYFLKWTDAKEEGGNYFEDEYIIGGNHGRMLHHGGTFIIKEMAVKK